MIYIWTKFGVAQGLLYLLLIYAILRASRSNRIFRTSLVIAVQNSPEFLFGMGIIVDGPSRFLF